MSQFPSNTFGAELLTLAVRCGVAGSSPDGPTLPEGSTFDELKAAYLDAADTFAKDRSWAWMTPRISVTLSPDGAGATNVKASPHVYALGSNVRGQPIDPESSLGWPVSVGSAPDIRRAISVNQGSGLVSTIATEEQGVGNSADQGEVGTLLLVYPKPTQAEVLTFRMKLRDWKPRDLTDVLAWGSEHHQTVRRLAMVNLMDNGQAEGDIDRATALATAELNRSRRIDTDAHGGRGTMGVPVVSNLTPPYRYYRD
jgi:hypothetical protein